jgi:hypothetical protein
LFANLNPSYEGASIFLFSNQNLKDMMVDTDSRLVSLLADCRFVKVEDVNWQMLLDGLDQIKFPLLTLQKIKVAYKACSETLPDGTVIPSHVAYEEVEVFQPPRRKAPSSH